MLSNVLSIHQIDECLELLSQFSMEWIQIQTQRTETTRFRVSQSVSS